MDAIDVVDAENRARQDRAVMGAMWRPIETAPKDGTWFLAWDDVGVQVRIVHWHERSQWFTDSDYFNDPVFPTHWMPLPEPPKTGDA